MNCYLFIDDILGPTDDDTIRVRTADNFIFMQDDLCHKATVVT